MTVRRLGALFAALLAAAAAGACTYTGPPEDERFPQNNHGRPN